MSKIKTKLKKLNKELVKIINRESPYNYHFEKETSGGYTVVKKVKDKNNYE